MMHPDQIYSVRQLQHQDLRAEAARQRANAELIGKRTNWRRFVSWLRAAGVHWMRGALAQTR